MFIYEGVMSSSDTVKNKAIETPADQMCWSPMGGFDALPPEGGAC